MGKKRKKSLGKFALASNSTKDSQNSTTAAPSLDGDKVKKEYLELLYMQKKRENLLLGDFAADGSYKISDEKFLKELKSIPKKFDEKIDNVVYANAILGPYILKFKIEFQIKEDFCSSVLSFIEIEQGIEEDVKHITVLDKHLGVYSPTYAEEVYELWKVYFDEEIYEKNDFLHDYLKKREEEFLFSMELTEVLAQIYLVRMLKFLDGFGEEGEKIKQEYKLLVEKLSKNDPSFMQNHTKLKKILDKIIIEHKALDAIAKTAEGAEILNEFASPLRRVFQMSSPSIVEAAGKDVKKEDEKKQETKTAAKKPAAKKKGKAKSSGGASFKPFIMDPKKAFGKLSVGGYSIPKVDIPKTKDSGGPKPASPSIEIKPQQPKPEPQPQEKPKEEQDVLELAQQAAAKQHDKWREKGLKSNVQNSMNFVDLFDDELDELEKPRENVEVAGAEKIVPEKILDR